MYRDFRNQAIHMSWTLFAFCLLFLSPVILAATADTEDVKALARLYSAAFDRDPNIDGLNFWVDSFEKGRSINGIANDFYKSQEFTKKYGPLTDTQYIEQLYRNVLGRDGEQSGIDFWVNHLRNGTARAVILASFAKSPENVAKTNTLFANMHFEGGVWLYGSNSNTGNVSIDGLIEEGSLILVDRQGNIRRVAFAFERQPNGVFDVQSHYFIFSDLPANRGFSIYYIIEGKIYTLFGGTGGNPGSNIFSFSDGASATIGLVPYKVIGYGRLVAQHSLLNQAGVVALQKDARIPIGLETPPLDGLTIEELTQSGLSALYSGWISGANAYFEKVVASTTPKSSQYADIARFYLAFSQVAAAATETPSDGNASSLDRIGDILDLLSIPDDYVRGSPRWLETPDDLDQNAVTAEQIKDWLDSGVRKKSARAATLLGQISPNFNLVWLRKDNRQKIENDYSDSVFFLGSVNLLRAYIAILDAYNLNANVNDLVARNTDDLPDNDYTVEEFLNTNPKFLSLESQEQLAKARDLLVNGAINNLQLAIDSMESEADPQDDDLISLADVNTDDLNSVRSYLANVKTSINQGQTLIANSDSGDRSKNIILDLKRFFNVGVDFRGSNLLPAVDRNKLDTSRQCLPDPTFNGVVISPDLDATIYDGSRCN
jgi:Domain of unknown function (DUF4214)